MTVQGKWCQTLPCGRCRAVAALCCRLPSRRCPPCGTGVGLRGLLLQQVLLGHARKCRRPRRRLLLLLLGSGYSAAAAVGLTGPVLPRVRASCVLCALLRGVEPATTTCASGGALTELQRLVWQQHVPSANLMRDPGCSVQRGQKHSSPNSWPAAVPLDTQGHPMLRRHGGCTARHKAGDGLRADGKTI